MSGTTERIQTIWRRYHSSRTSKKSQKSDNSLRYPGFPIQQSSEENSPSNEKVIQDFLTK